jgi:hypothetical protein
MLQPTKHVAENPKPQYVCGEGLSKNILLNVLIWLAVFNKDKDMAKSIVTFKKTLKVLALWEAIVC